MSVAVLVLVLLVLVLVLVLVYVHGQGDGRVFQTPTSRVIARIASRIAPTIERLFG